MNIIWFLSVLCTNTSGPLSRKASSVINILFNRRWISFDFYLSSVPSPQIHFPSRGATPRPGSSMLDHRSLLPMFESWRGYIWRVFHLWLCFITFGGSSAHLAYHVHKSGRKTSIIIIITFLQGILHDYSFN